MKDVIIANFKMNKTFSETKEYVKELSSLVDNSASKIYLCLPYTSLYISKLYKGKLFKFGAQNVHEEEYGAYTGEISAQMLKDLKIELVIVGHSERRKMGESNDVINKKIKTALRFGLEVVLCVGETRAQKNTNKTEFAIKKELSEALSGIYENELNNITIAYEPVWAVGTGKIADFKDILAAVETIRAFIAQLYSKDAAKNIKVVYGGSVDSQNAKQIIKSKNINGVMLGGTSLDPNNFAKLLK